MYNFVIFISDFNFIKKMGNIIFNSFKSMNLVGIVSTHKELEALCKKQKINLIILSETKYNSKPIQNIVKNIESSIVICESNISSCNNTDNILFLSVNDSEDSIINSLCRFNTLINNHFLKNKLIHILETLNFDFKSVGTTYFLDAIIYSYLTKDSYKFENLEKYIYPWVSQKYAISSNNIKYAISRSINSMKKHSKTQDFEKLNINYPDKITSKFLITEIINHL